MNAKLNRNVFAALAFSVWCLLMRYAFSGEGYHTLSLFGSEYGLANLKAHPFVVVRGRLIDFPYHVAFFTLALIACAIAVVMVWRHFTLRRTDA